MKMTAHAWNEKINCQRIHHDIHEQMSNQDQNDKCHSPKAFRDAKNDIDQHIRQGACAPAKQEQPSLVVRCSRKCRTAVAHGNHALELDRRHVGNHLHRRLLGDGGGGGGDL